MSRIIGVVSGKGGVGKTTVVANLGVALTKFEKKVTLVDCNVTTSHLGFYFGLYYYPKTLNNVLKGEISILDSTYLHQTGVNIVPASLALEDLMDVDIGKLKPSLSKISETSDMVLLDSAPGLGREAMGVLNSCEEVLFVTIPTFPAVTDISRCNKIIDKLGIKPLGVVLNMVRNTVFELTEGDVEELTNLPVLAKIPFDKNIGRSLELGLTNIEFKPLSKSSVAFTKLAAGLVGESYSPPKRMVFSRIYDALKQALS